jgi:hypothetical protein
MTLHQGKNAKSNNILIDIVPSNTNIATAVYPAMSSSKAAPSKMSAAPPVLNKPKAFPKAPEVETKKTIIQRPKYIFISSS